MYVYINIHTDEGGSSTAMNHPHSSRRPIPPYIFKYNKVSPFKLRRPPENLCNHSFYPVKLPIDPSSSPNI